MILRNAHEIKNLMNIPLKNGCIKDQLQGRRSHMRRKISSPKIMTMRCQIGLRFDLSADEMIIPVNMLDKFKLFIDMSLSKQKLFDLTDPRIQKSKFITLPDRYTFLLKRDPVIHQ
ncbi:Lef-9 protein, partial [Dolichomitus sp. PSUC_FEM 10030005]|nr:Lef-9 protein [Dolichomitus sp. PSUC_FEM 10030005]